jgi:hypothetical protein
VVAASSRGSAAGLLLCVRVVLAALLLAMLRTALALQSASGSSACREVSLVGECGRAAAARARRAGCAASYTKDCTCSPECFAQPMHTKYVVFTQI